MQWLCPIMHARLLYSLERQARVGPIAHADNSLKTSRHGKIGKPKSRSGTAVVIEDYFSGKKYLQAQERIWVDVRRKKMTKEEAETQKGCSIAVGCAELFYTHGTTIVKALANDKPGQRDRTKNWRR